MRILYFGPLRDLVGTDEQDILEVTNTGPADTPKTVAEVVAAVVATYPEAAELIGSCATAVNLDYVDNMNTLVSMGDSIALIPPVSAG